MGEADFTAARDPFALFEAWFQDAVKSEPNDPNGMALATSDVSGMPNGAHGSAQGGRRRRHAGTRVRVLHQHRELPRERSLPPTHGPACYFTGKSLRRQVRVRRPTSFVSLPEEGDAYFATRPRLSRIGAWASDQSRPLESRFALEE